MNLMIGEKIRQLRRAGNLTQEEAARHLGVSFQAISKWERGEGYPDITLLPALANYFQVSVDELIGMQDIASRDRYDEINRLWEENRRAGRHRENAALMREALRTYPNDALLLVQLSSSLERMEGSEDERQACLRESAAVQEQILSCCADSEVRGATMYNICFTYRKLGEHQKALEQAEKLPNLYKARENALIYFLTGEEKRQTALNALEPIKWIVRLQLGALAETDDPAWQDRAEQIVRLLEGA